MPSATALHLTPADLASQAAEDAQYFRATLHELIDMGMGMARVVHKQATAEPEGTADEAAPLPAPDAAAAFDRLSRAVRRTVAMARHVAQPVPARPAVPRPDQQRAAARRQIIREVEDTLQRTAGVDADALQAELQERLDGSELDDEIEGRPTAEVIADICRDLGVAITLGAHPWKRRTPEDVAALCARAAEPAGAPRDVARPVLRPGEPWPEPAVPSPSPPRDAGAAAGLVISDAACVAQMWSVLAEAGWQTPFKPGDG